MAAYIGIRYIFERSDEEIAAIKSRPESEVYLSVDKPIAMTVINDEGELAMKIEGSSVTLSKDQEQASFKDAKAEYYENGESSLTFEAGTVEYNTRTEDFTIYGGYKGADSFKIETRDGMAVSAPRVEWRRFKEAATPASREKRAPSFRFPNGVEVTSRDGNRLSSAYMQADRELTYMEFIGNVRGDVASLQDTQFITERELTDVGELKLEDFEKLVISAEEVIYDKQNQVVLATSRYYDRAFKVKDFEGQIIDIGKYQTTPQQVKFSKEDVTVATDHLEAHIARKWAECYGNIGMVIKPSQPKKFGEDKAVQAMRKYETRIQAGDIEYFWGRDCVISHSRAAVIQADRRAEADKLTYWGGSDKPEYAGTEYAEKMVLLDGNIVMAQGSGDWLLDENLIEIGDHDQARLIGAYSEMYADKAVMYLNNNDFIASGKVWLRQDNREISAQTIVYQDQIKRLTAKEDVKFKDKDGQTFLCAALVYNNDSKYMEVEGGASATIRLPAKYANDINRAVAESREEPVPAEISDPDVPLEPTRDPNKERLVASHVDPEEVKAPGKGLGIPPINSGVKRDPGSEDLFIPDDPSAPEEESRPQELILRLGEDGVEIPEGIAGEPQPPEEGEESGGEEE
ncbi:hypothetical protein IT575_11080 [bacterium]|nr:hypothetical protein [bacterium]